MASGSLLLTLRTFYHTLRISVPTVTEALFGGLTAERCDARLRDWAETLVAITRTRLVMSGQRHLPRQACVVMSNHRSLADIPVIYAALPEEVRLRMVTKAELFRVPVWGRAMRCAGFIPIERGARARAIQSLEVAKAALAGGTFIWIAPEGTRSRSGRLLPFKKGGFIMARDVGCPILPVHLDGSERIVPPDSVRTYRDNTVRVAFGPPIRTAGRPIEEVMEEVRLHLAPASAPLVPPGPPRASTGLGAGAAPLP